LGRMLRDAAKDEKYATAVGIIRQIALTGCRRSEMIRLKWTEADTEGSCLRLADSKEGESIRPIGLPVLEYLEKRRTDEVGTYVFPGQGEDNAFGSFPNHWKQQFKDSLLSDVTPHVLRHSFASIANDLGFTEVTIAALVGHAKGSVTSKYIHTLDTALIMAADTISGYIQGLLDGIEYRVCAGPRLTKSRPGPLPEECCGRRSRGNRRGAPFGCLSATPSLSMQHQATQMSSFRCASRLGRPAARPSALRRSLPDSKLRTIKPRATLPTLRANQVENRKAAATNSPNAKATAFCS